MSICIKFLKAYRLSDKTYKIKGLKFEITNLNRWSS